MAGQTIIAPGRPDQKGRYLAKILSAEEIWCQGFSEPGSGSDLASVRTRVDLVGDHFVVNGQKVWSSYAHIADRCILLGRSAAEGEKHEGLTYLIVDIKSPGVEVRPLRQITGEAEFNEIFFTDVAVPKENLLGEVGGGWRVAMTTLSHERGTFGFALAGALDVAVRRLVALARERAGNDALVRDRVAREWIDLQALRYTNYRALARLERTGVPGPEGSVAKLRWSEANQRLTKLAIEIIGREGQVGAGLSFVEEAIVFEELGRALYSGPYFSTVALALPALACAPDLLARVASGALTATLASAAAHASGTAVEARRSGDRWLLRGEADLVPDAGWVDALVVQARGPDGFGLYLAERHDARPLVRVLDTVDATRRLARVTFEDDDARLLAASPAAATIIAATRRRALAALALEAVGGASRALLLGVEHPKSPRQLGRPLGPV